MLCPLFHTRLVVLKDMMLVRIKLLCVNQFIGFDDPLCFLHQVGDSCDLELQVSPMC